MKAAKNNSEFSYHLLRNALDIFSKNLPALQPDEYERVLHSASKSFELESLVLASAEAQSYVVPVGQLESSLAEIRQRYSSDDEFQQDLQANGMTEAAMRAALYRELVFDGVMQMVGARAAAIDDLDSRLFYEMHHDRFQQPEARHARHILITVNPDFAENTEQAACQRVEEIASKLGQRANRFAKFARRYSECPTAMEGGKLGQVRRGQLFPELDAQLFSLEEGEIGPVVESELGWHILWCERIRPARRVPFSRAEPKIRQMLAERRRRNCQKTWLAELRQQAGGLA